MKYYTITSQILKCPIHYTYDDIYFYSKEKLEKDSLFKPCHGHYHTVRKQKNIIICPSKTCVKKQKKIFKRQGL